MGVATKIQHGKSTVKGKPTVKAGPSQTSKLTTAKPGVAGKSGGC